LCTERSILEFLKLFITSEVYAELEQARKSNVGKLKKKKKKKKKKKGS